MTEETAPYDVLGAGAGGPLPAPTPWLQGPGYVQYLGGVIIGQPTGGNTGAGTLNLSDLFINGSAFDPGVVLMLTGGTLTGPLTLAANPTANLGAATKQYVDSAVSTAGVGTFLPLTGGTLTGSLSLNADPTIGLGASTKQYVDNRTPITADAPNDGNYYVRRNFAWVLNPGGITIPDAPSDSSTYGRNNGAWTNVFDSGTF